jgi:hypothetical protein
MLLLNSDSVSNDLKFKPYFFLYADTIILDNHVFLALITITRGVGVTIRSLVSILKNSPDVELKIYLTSIDKEVRFYLKGINKLWVYLNVTIPNRDVLKGHYKIPTP